MRLFPISTPFKHGLAEFPSTRCDPIHKQTASDELSIRATRHRNEDVPLERPVSGIQVTFVGRSGLSISFERVPNLIRRAASDRDHWNRLFRLYHSSRIDRFLREFAIRRLQ